MLKKYVFITTLLSNQVYHKDIENEFGFLILFSLDSTNDF